MSTKLFITLLALIACFSVVFGQQVKIISSDIPGGVCTTSSVANGDAVSILYVGKLEDGSVFDASSKHDNKPFTFLVGEKKVIPGYEQGIMGMCEGEKREFIIPYELAYGENGIEGVIPPRAALTFEVEVVKIEKLSEIPFYYKLIPSREVIGAFIIVSAFVVILKYVLQSFPSPVEKKLPKKRETPKGDKKKN